MLSNQRKRSGIAKYVLFRRAVSVLRFEVRCLSMCVLQVKDQCEDVTDGRRIIQVLVPDKNTLEWCCEQLGYSQRIVASVAVYRFQCTSETNPLVLLEGVNAVKHTS